MKLRLSWILPLVQLPLAIFLLEWGEHSAQSADVIRMRYDTLYFATPTLICGGINAPARFLAATSRLFDRVDHAQPTIAGLTGLRFLYDWSFDSVVLGWQGTRQSSVRQVRVEHYQTTFGRRPASIAGFALLL